MKLALDLTFRHPASGRTTRMAGWPLAAALILSACQTPAAPTAAPVKPTKPAVVASATVAAAPTVVPTEAPAATATLPVLSADDVIEAVHQAWATAGLAGPRRLVQTSSDADGAGTVIEAEFVPPDSLHQVVKIGGQKIAEQYNMGGVLYNNAPTSGGWVRTDLPGSLNGALAMFSDAAGDSITYSDARVEGSETVNGYNAVIYAYATQLEGFAMVVKHRLWVDTGSGLPVKNEIVSDEGQTVQEIVYSADVAIVLPDDVAAAPPAP